MSISSIVLDRSGRRRARHPRTWVRRRGASRLAIESLEVRSLLNGAMPAVATVAYPPNETIDQAWELGSLTRPESMIGSVGLGADGAADVTWYHFQLQDAARVNLSLAAPAGDRPFQGVLTLYESDPEDWNDPYDPTGDILLAQASSAGNGTDSYSQDLGPGNYYVAISGAGNTAFSPVLAGSGYPGAMGVYELTAGAADLGLSGDGPAMLSSEPAAGSVLDSSPLAIRVELSAPLDPATVAAGQTVQLLEVTAGGLIAVPLASTNVSTAGDELQLFPASPLAPGQYVVQLSGDSGQDPAVLAGPNDLPLGQDAQHPDGVDESFTFRVAGVDGVAGATASDDTPATARQLGSIAGAGLIQVAGAIGVDPNLPYDPGNQVDLYHFEISGPGRYAVLAEVFAGRIGSPLDPGLSLFELDPSTGQLVFLAGNNNTQNATEGTDGSLPLFLDSALSDGLTAGNYYLAVAGGWNTPSPLENQQPGSPGIFDPNQPGSAQNGWSTGAYQLNVLVQGNPAPPRVVASSPAPGQVLNAPPTQITVQFSEPVDLQQFVYADFAAVQTTDSQVYIEGADGTRYLAQLEAYNNLTNTATFQMLDELPDGSYALHLSGPGGLTDLAGNPLVGNDRSGDDVIDFTVSGAADELSGSNSGGFWTVAQAAAGATQDIGVLFPDQIQAGVNILSYPGSPDAFTFQVTQNRFYTFNLIGSDLPASAQVTLTDASGQPVTVGTQGGQLYEGFLAAGTYTVSVGGWAPGAGAGLSYQLLIGIPGGEDNASPLTDAPSPALVVSFATSAGSSASGSAGGLELFGGMMTPFSAAGGGSAGAIGGGSGAAETGPVATTIVGASPAGASAATVAGLSQAEAATGLAGLGMGPLGGFGGQSGALASSSVQVAINAPSASATPSGAVAVGLVTMTQVFSWTSVGEGVTPPEAGEVPVVVACEAPEPAGDRPLSVAVGGGPAVRPDVAPIAAVALPAGPVGGLAFRIDPPRAAAAAGPATTEESAAPMAGAPAIPAAGRGPRPADEDWTVRWLVAAATIAAVYRSRTVIRGLESKKGTRAGFVSPSARVHSAHDAVQRSRSGVPAADARGASWVSDSTRRVEHPSTRGGPGITASR